MSKIIIFETSSSSTTLDYKINPSCANDLDIIIENEDSQVDWLTVTNSYNISSNSGSVTLDVAENTTTARRRENVLVKIDGKVCQSKTIVVTQKGVIGCDSDTLCDDALSLNNQSLEDVVYIDSSGGTFENSYTIHNELCVIADSVSAVSENGYFTVSVNTADTTFSISRDRNQSQAIIDDVIIFYYDMRNDKSCNQIRFNIIQHAKKCYNIEMPFVISCIGQTFEPVIHELDCDETCVYTISPNKPSGTECGGEITFNATADCT